MTLSLFMLAAANPRSLGPAQITGSYDIFTKPQAPANRLRREQWYQLRDIIRWIQPTHATGLWTDVRLATDSSPPSIEQRKGPVVDCVLHTQVLFTISP